MVEALLGHLDVCADLHPSMCWGIGCSERVFGGASSKMEGNRCNRARQSIHLFVYWFLTHASIIFGRLWIRMDYLSIAFTQNVKFDAFDVGLELLESTERLSSFRRVEIEIRKECP